MLRCMRWALRRTRMVERTCFECGEIWTVDARLAKITPPGRRRPRFSVGTVLGAQRDLSLYRTYMHQQMSESRRRQSPASLELAMLREVGKCRMCGSTHYIENEI
jgi:hypothetical protein